MFAILNDPMRNFERIYIKDFLQKTKTFCTKKQINVDTFWQL